MKVGSLVTLLAPLVGEIREGVVRVPEYGEILTVRDMFRNPASPENILLVFEEFVIGISERSGREIGSNSKYFREIQPPMDLTELLEETVKHTLIISQPLTPCNH